MRGDIAKRALLVSALALCVVACDDSDTSQQPPEVKVYASVDACKAEQPEDECQKAFDGARDEHDRTAPRFQAQATCEDLYGPGNCVPRHSEYGGNDVFIPYMMGYMMGHSSGSTVVYHYPVYVDRGGTAYSRGSSIGTFARTAPSAPATISRGGFGGSASSAPTGMGGFSGKVAISPGAVARGGFGGIATSMASSGGG